MKLDAGAAKTRANVALDWLSFFLADVKGTLGPYLGIYLLTVQRWDQAMIGLLMTICAMVGLIVKAPLGAFVDAARFKRALIVTGVTCMGMAALLVPLISSFSGMLALRLTMGIAAGLFPPAVTAISLGVVGYTALAGRMARNGAFDHAGNVCIALAAAFVGSWWSQQAIFYLAPVFAVICVAVVLRIPSCQIDHRLARGLEKTGATEKEPVSFPTLLAYRPLLILALCAACFHFANAPMLHLVGQRLALAHPGQEALMMSACIIGAQAVMLPMALWAGKCADRWGRKTVFLVAFAALPMRGLLYTVSDDRWWLLTVQLLDGVGAGIFGVIAPLIIADLTRGSGRFNVSLGLVATVQGVGAALSNVVAGMLVVKFGYDVAFLCLSGVAVSALVLFGLAMPETRGLKAGEGFLRFARA